MLIAIVCAISILTSAGICVYAGGFESLAWLWILPVSFIGSFLVLAVLAFLFLWFLCAIVRLDKPQEKDSRLYRTITRLYIQALVTVAQVHITAEGMEKTPKDGRFMLVCNHTHDTDPIVLLHKFPKSQLAFISKRENDQKFLVGKLMHKILCQPINRENDREALKTILKCIQLLKDDLVSVAVFPEGYVHMPDRKLHHFRHGVFKIAQKAKVPVVVCTLKGTKHIFENFARLKPTQVQLHLLDVIPAEEVTACTTVALGERIYNMMARDLGEDYVADPMYEETT